MTVLILAAALVCQSPQGHRLMLGSEVVPPSDEVVSAMATTHWGEASRYLAQRGGCWYRIALSADTAFTWPARQTVAALTDSGEVVATDLLVMTPRPEERIVWELGHGPALIEPGNLWRKPLGHGQAVVMYARFGSTWMRPKGIAVVSQRRNP